MNKRRLVLCSILSAFVVIITLFTGCGGTKTTDKSLTTVKLNEVTRSVFYAPMYVAISEGFFKEEGINIDLSTGQGADATTSK